MVTDVPVHPATSEIIRFTFGAITPVDEPAGSVVLKYKGSNIGNHASFMFLYEHDILCKEAPFSLGCKSDSLNEYHW